MILKLAWLFKKNDRKYECQLLIISVVNDVTHFRQATRPQSDSVVVSTTQTHAQKLIGQAVSQPGIGSSASMVTGHGQLATLVPTQVRCSNCT